MIGYRDMTFCTKSTCANWNNCQRALTEDVQEKADAWWGSHPAPIITFTDKPKCYEPSGRGYDQEYVDRPAERIESYEVIQENKPKENK